MISTVIPVHLRSKSDLSFLKRALRSLVAQIYKPSEVILSVDLCPDFNRFKEVIRTEFPELNLIFLKHSKPLGISANTNMGLNQVSERYVHVLHQDDWLFKPDVYAHLSVAAQENTKQFFLLSGLRLERIYRPHFDLTALVGNNQIGGPSGIFFPYSDDSFFDENLTMLLDVDFVFSLIKKFGEPTVLDKVCIEYGVSDEQAQNLVTDIDFSNELVYVFHKHQLKSLRIALCSLLTTDVDVMFSVSQSVLKVPTNKAIVLIVKSIRFFARVVLFLRRNRKKF
jgi:glycosyltransferase involved in cell wall biosynthesis